MKNSQNNNTDRYDDVLEKSIHIFENKLRNDIAQILHTHTVFIEFLDKQKNKEKTLFYDLKNKIDTYMNTFRNCGKKIVFLFDIDETLTEYGSNTIRPSGEIIIQYIQQCYTNADFGLCSARESSAVETFASKNGIGSTYLFSSREISSDINEDEADMYGLQTNGARNKYNAWKKISQQHMLSQFVLIDDLFDNQKLLSDKGVVILFDKNLIATQFDIYDYI